jgi:FkbM family methyltransferase
MIDQTLIKRVLQRWAYAFGSVIGSKGWVNTFAFAEQLRDIFADYAIATVIDVGANEGQFARFLRNKVGFTGKIESFEPIPALAQKLMTKAAADGRWAVHQRALGAKPGTLTLNVMKDSVFSSFLKPVAPANSRRNTMNRVIDTTDVIVSTLDAEFFGTTDLRHTFLKLDTQGFDLEVLKGGEKLIMVIPALQTEVSFQPIYKNMPGYKESIAAFERYGFVVTDFHLVGDFKHMAIEFDCVMVRRPAGWMS